MPLSVMDGEESESSIPDMAPDHEWLFEDVTGERLRRGRKEYRIQFMDSWVNGRDRIKWRSQIDTILESAKNKYLIRWKPDIWVEACNVPSEYVAGWREKQRQRRKQRAADQRNRAHVERTQLSKTSDSPVLAAAIETDLKDVVSPLAKHSRGQLNNGQTPRKRKRQEPGPGARAEGSQYDKANAKLLQRSATQRQSDPATQGSHWPSPSPTPCEADDSSSSQRQEIPDTFEDGESDVQQGWSQAHQFNARSISEEAHSQQRAEKPGFPESPFGSFSRLPSNESFESFVHAAPEAWEGVVQENPKVTCFQSSESRSRTLAGEAGRPEPHVRILRLHPANHQLQQQAREALANLPDHKDPTDAPSVLTTGGNSSRAIDEGEIPPRQPQSYNCSPSASPPLSRCCGVGTWVGSTNRRTFLSTVLNTDQDLPSQVSLPGVGSGTEPVRDIGLESRTSAGTQLAAVSRGSPLVAMSSQEDSEARSAIAPWGTDTTLQGQAQAHSGPQHVSGHIGATMAPSPTIQVSTVTPSEVSTLGAQARDTQGASTTLPLLPGQTVSSSASQSLSANSIPLGQIPLPLIMSQSASPKPSATNYHVITIPFHASTRAQYLDTMRRHMSTFIKFNQTFSAEDDRDPDRQLQSEIDEALTDLMYDCDYGGESLEISPGIDIETQMQHIVDKVSKVRFLRELLPALGRVKVLIVVGSDNLTRLMIHLVSRINKLPWFCPENQAARCDPQLVTNAPQAPLITIATSRHAEAGDFDLVIAYDRSFNGSTIASSMTAASASQSTPTVLRLVTTLSVEHLELAIAGESQGSDQGQVENLEKTIGLVWALVHAQPLLDGTPEPGEPSLPDQPQPHRIAAVFASYLSGDSADLDYEPVQVPAHILRPFLTQSSPAASFDDAAEDRSATDLKRKLEDDADDTEVPEKRLRRYSCIQPLFPTDTIPVPPDVRSLLKSAGLRGPLQATGEDQVGIPIATLRALAAQLAEAQRRSPQDPTLELAEQAYFEQLDELRREHEADCTKFEEAQRAHLRECDHFDRMARELEKQLNAQSAQALKRQEKDAAEIAELAAKVARLTGDGGDALKQTESLLGEAQEKINLLEKQIEQAKVERGYAFEQYQMASSAAEEVRDEVKKLAEANRDLQRRADTNIVEIRRMNRDGVVKQLEARLSAEQVAKAEVVQENHVLREQIRQLKIARRDTRHSSVPRSPRTGIMSPRPQRPAGPSSVSRGASPAPIMGSFVDMYNSGNGAMSRTPGAQFTSTNNGGDRS